MRSSCPTACWSRSWCSSCGALLQAVQRYDREIAELAPTLPDYTVFASFPGAGPVFAPRLLAAFGEQRNRYQLAARSRSSPASPRSPSAAATSAGCTGACSAPRSCARPSWNGPACRSRTATGPKPTTSSNALEGPHTRRRCARSPSNGSASCFAAGRTIRHTTRPDTSTPSNATALRCLLAFRNPDKPLDGLPQGVGWVGRHNRMHLTAICPSHQNLREVSTASTPLPGAPFPESTPLSSFPPSG